MRFPIDFSIDLVELDRLGIFRISIGAALQMLVGVVGRCVLRPGNVPRHFIGWHEQTIYSTSQIRDV